MQPELTDLPSYQHMLIGLISGAMGPFSNAPIDTIKTRACFLCSVLSVVGLLTDCRASLVFVRVLPLWFSFLL